MARKGSRMKPPAPDGLQIVRMAHAALMHDAHPARIPLLLTVIDLQLRIVATDTRRWALARWPVGCDIPDYLAFFPEELN